MTRWLTALALFAWLPFATAAIDALPFDDPAQEARYQELVEELRCVVCQNQNLADSNAELAKDLRRQTYEMVNAGKGKEEIIDYMVARYGDFVLYRPPVRPATYPLWFGPVLLFLTGAVALVLFVRRRTRRDDAGDDEDNLSKAEAQRLQRLLDRERTEGGQQ